MIHFAAAFSEVSVTICEGKKELAHMTVRLLTDYIL
jgi:hypothetical protein